MMAKFLLSNRNNLKHPIKWLNIKCIYKAKNIYVEG